MALDIIKDNLDPMRPEYEHRETRKTSWVHLLVLVGALLVAFISVLSTVNLGNRGRMNPQYVGDWSLMHSDGTTENLRFHADGTISANDDYVYRWAADEAAVRIVAHEQVSVSVDGPTSVFRYLFPRKTEVILIPQTSEENAEVLLLGNSVKLRRVQNAE